MRRTTSRRNLFFCLCLLQPAALAALDGSRYLWYRQPAAEWERGALPIGNGRMGATIFGGLDEVVTVNEDTIWSGPPQDRTPAGGPAALARARELFLAGNITGGGDLVMAEMNPPEEAKSQRQFSYFGNLRLGFGHAAGGSVGNYLRWLDTRAGNSGVSYTYQGVNYTREYIASFPGDILAARFEASQEGALNLDASIYRSQYTLTNVASVQGDTATVSYRGSSGQAEEQNPIVFLGQARFVADGASISTSGSTVVIRGATVIDVFFDAETNYRYPQAEALQAEVERKLDAAVSQGYEAVRAAALADSTALLGRASLDLGRSAPGRADLPTDERVRNARTASRDDVELTTLAWNLGRHMLVASSRNTGEDVVDFPANLQGVWNNRTYSAWGGKYTINVNTEMNYWAAMTTNLLETQEPLFDLMRVARPRGEQMARDMYGCGGGAVVFHHNLDLWADTAPTDKYRSSSMWPMGAAWLVQHMIEHWRFTGDAAFLEGTAYPYLRSVADFLYCYAFELDGYRVTGPSLSPENAFVVPAGYATAGRSEPMDVNIAMDDQLMRDVLRALLEAASALGVPDSDPVVVRAAEFLAAVRPAQIGSLGQILEWRADYREATQGHRHFSHLYALHPGAEFAPLNNITLANAASVSVDRRVAAGSGSTGWSCTWLINMYARLLRGEDAWARAQSWFERYPTEGLWNTDQGVTFQIDGNFGFTSGITEMLLQSHAGAGGNSGGVGILHLLPALPAESVPAGRAGGLTARGGFVVDVAWEGGRLRNATVASNLGAELRVRVQSGVSFLVDGAAYREPISTEKGAKYVITLA